MALIQLRRMTRQGQSDQNFEINHLDILSLCVQGWTALHQAAFHGHYEVCKVLVAKSEVNRVT